MAGRTLSRADAQRRVAKAHRERTWLLEDVRRAVYDAVVSLNLEIRHGTVSPVLEAEWQDRVGAAAVAVAVLDQLAAEERDLAAAAFERELELIRRSFAAHKRRNAGGER
jgi:hypothetical protein